MSVVLAGQNGTTATLKVSDWPCVTKPSTLVLETVAISEDAPCTKESEFGNSTCNAGKISVSTVAGSVSSDGMFYQKGQSSAYQLPLGDGAYVARVELECE